MQLHILVQVSLKVQNVSNSGSHSLRSLVIHDFVDMFSKYKASKLANHWPYDLKITLVEGTSLPYGPIYSLSQEELTALHNSLTNTLQQG